MDIGASAPGKLVMAGDYAVLEGAPALVVALDRRARVQLDASDDGTFCIDAPEMDIRGVHGRLEAGYMRWSTDTDTTRRLRLVTAVLEYLAANGMAPDPMHMTLDTRAFFAGDGQAKLGLGSSAALTVALAGALQALRDQPAPDLATMITMHRHMQGDRGSGLDIATSLTGGTLLYRLREDQPEVVRATWPRDLGMCCVWSGRAASTGTALARLADWRQQHPDAYKGHMQALAAGATAIAMAIEARDATAVAEGMAGYAGGLARLGQASGIDIVCAEHRALADLAFVSGVAYKSCGAGGGDIGVAVSDDAERLAHFADRAAHAGFLVLDAGIDAQGLSVRAATPSKRRPSWTTYA